jgi:hypothetical protein
MVIILKNDLTAALVLTTIYLLIVVEDIIALDHTQTHALYRNLLDDGCVHSTGLYLTTHNAY